MNEFSFSQPEMQQKLALVMPKDGKTPAVVFSDISYLAALKNWISYARKTGFDNILVVSLDKDIYEYAKENRIKSILMNYDNNLTDLWIQRAEFFSLMCSLGYDFIHTDADAIWVRNPLDYCFALPADIIFSQGTIWPTDVLNSWGFVLCCGFFAVRACPGTRLFFKQVSAITRIVKDDQLALNRLLIDEGIEWEIDSLNYTEKVYKNHKYKIFNFPVFGKLSNLRIALLPYKKFPRTVESNLHEAIVAHPLSPKTCVGKKEVLEEIGLWRL